MPNYTANLNLKKPLGTENYDVADQNGNMDILDSSIASHLADYLKHGIQGTTDATGTTTAYTLTPNPALSSYAQGLPIEIFFDKANTGSSTINISGKGNITLKKQDGTTYAAGELKTDTPYRFVHNGTDFLADSSVGYYGTAGGAQTLTGYTTVTKTGIVNGLIPIKAAATYTPGTTDQTIAANQYLSGIQTIKGDAKLISENLKANISIFNVTGKASVVDTADATALVANLLLGVTAYVNGTKITGTMANNGAVNIIPSSSQQNIPAGYHNGSGIVSPIALSAGDNVFSTTPGPTAHSSTYLMAKMWSVQFDQAGSVRLKFSFKATVNTTGVDARAQVYINDVPYGTIFEVSTTTPIECVQDVTFNAGDIVQIYTQKLNSSSNYAEASNIRICANFIPPVFTLV